MINSDVGKDFVIITYPRAGSHFFQNYIKQQTGVFIEKTHSHELINGRVPISIIRNPYDCLKSCIAMHMHFYPEKNTMLSDEEVLQKYIDFYKNFNLDGHMLVSYEDLIHKTEKVGRYFSDILNVDFLNVDYNNDLIDRPEYQYLVSSKNSKNFLEIEKYDIDLSECEDIYQNALAQCINF